jgi:serine/threonine protein kinase
MGEVYKARDTRLDRTVAVKVLPPHIASREDLRARFEREARAVSSLSHPNICTLFDVGKQDGVSYMVMEHLEGETLFDCLQRGPLPLDQALKYGMQIADAVDRAHRSGVVHRDLKPGNVMITRNGPKVLDFGLAKTAPKAAADGETLTMAITSEGTVLGTPQYMAPEQIEGKEADARTDIFAFGCMLYEMVTGKRAFDGKTKASVIGAILASEPAPMSTLQPVTPPMLERVVTRCLAKDPEDRYQSMRDVLLDLRLCGEAPEPQQQAPKRHRWLWPAATAAAVVASAAAAWLARTPEAPRVIQFSVNPPKESEFVSAGTNAGNSAISPDGIMLAFSARTKGKMQIWIRRLDSIESRALPGTEGGYYPFWSPDGRRIGFFADGKLKKIDIAGGPAQSLCDARPGRGGTWNADGVILFSGSPARTERRIMRVPAAGGTPVVVTTFDTSENAHYWPWFLPDGRHFLYTARANEAAKSGIWVADLDSPGNRKRLVETLSNGIYAGADQQGLFTRNGGYVLFTRDRALLAQAFDPSTLQLKSEAFPLAEGISYAANIALADFSASTNGVLAYGAGAGDLRRLVWRDRSGKQTGIVGEPSRNLLFTGLRLSPDNKRLLYFRMDSGPGTGDFWIADLDRATESRFTFESVTGMQAGSTWCAGNRRIVYRTADKIYRKAADGSGEPELLLSGQDLVPSDCSPDGRLIMLTKLDSKTRLDLVVLEPEAGRDLKPYLATQFVESGGRFSPDGRWVAYMSDDSGVTQVYVRAFLPGKPASGARWQISTHGGFVPVWRSDGKELFYRTNDGALTAVSIQALGDTLQVGTPVRLFESGEASSVFDVTRDGQKFIETELAGQPELQTMTVVVNWPAALKR